MAETNKIIHLEYPDPFAILTVDGTVKFKTDPIKKTLNPYWLKKFTMYVKSVATFHFHVSILFYFHSSLLLTAFFLVMQLQVLFSLLLYMIAKSTARNKAPAVWEKLLFELVKEST